MKSESCSILVRRSFQQQYHPVQLRLPSTLSQNPCSAPLRAPRRPVPPLPVGCLLCVPLSRAQNLFPHHPKSARTPLLSNASSRQTSLHVQSASELYAIVTLCMAAHAEHAPVCLSCSQVSPRAGPSPGSRPRSVSRSTWPTLVLLPESPSSMTKLAAGNGSGFPRALRPRSAHVKRAKSVSAFAFDPRFLDPRSLRMPRSSSCIRG